MEIPLAASLEWRVCNALCSKGLSLRLIAVNQWQHRVIETNRKQEKEVNCIAKSGLGQVS